MDVNKPPHSDPHIFCGKLEYPFWEQPKTIKEEKVTWQNGLHVMVVGAVHVHTNWTCIKYMFLEKMVADAAISI